MSNRSPAAPRYSVQRNAYSGAWYIHDDRAHKVLVGPYHDEPKAREALAVMQRSSK